MRIVLLMVPLGLGVLPGPVHGQFAPAATGGSARPATRTLYISATGRFLPTADSADHREEMVYHDSTGGTVRVYYPSGKLRRVVPYLDFARGIQYGAECGFYETGEIKSRYEYGPAGPVGPAVQYYRNGQVRLRTSPPNAEYPKGLSEVFRPDGQLLVLPREQQQLPTLHGGGPAVILAAIQRQVRYPAEALRSGVTGKVFVAFLVDDAGFVRHVRVLKSPSPLLNGAVLQAVAALGRLTPGAMAGEPVEVSFTLPVTFAIR